MYNGLLARSWLQSSKPLIERYRYHQRQPKMVRPSSYASITYELLEVCDEEELCALDYEYESPQQFDCRYNILPDRPRKIFPLKRNCNKTWKVTNSLGLHCTRNQQHAQNAQEWGYARAGWMRPLAQWGRTGGAAWKSMNDARHPPAMPSLRGGVTKPIEPGSKNRSPAEGNRADGKDSDSKSSSGSSSGSGGAGVGAGVGGTGSHGSQDSSGRTDDDFDCDWGW